MYFPEVYLPGVRRLCTNHRSREIHHIIASPITICPTLNGCHHKPVSSINEYVEAK